MAKSFSVTIRKNIKNFNKVIRVEGDKSISHRALLLASQCRGASFIDGVLNSEDVLSTIKALNKFGVKIIKKNTSYVVFGNGLGSFKINKKITIDSSNAGTLTRLLFGLLSTYPNKVKITGDRSLKKRPMERVIKPLEKIGCTFYPKNKKNLPLEICGTSMPLAQKHIEQLGSAQVKSALIYSALNTPGITEIEERKISRDHTERMLKFIGAKIKIKKLNKGRLISIKGQEELNSFNLKIPGDPSSAAFFIVLTLLSKNSKLKIKDVNYNFTRLGYIEILKKMNGKIKIVNKRQSYGEKICDIIVKSSRLKSIICPKNIVPRTIDEFPILMLAAAKAKGVSKFSNLSELNKKESPRLKIMNQILNKIGVNTISTDESIIIRGKTNLETKRHITIDPKLDHRICMIGFILGQILKGKVKIKSFENVNTSSPKFLKIMTYLGAKYEIQK